MATKVRVKAAANVPACVAFWLVALIAMLLPLAARAGGPASGIATIAAPGDDALPTDRLIVKYRGHATGASASATATDRAALHRSAQDAAARFGHRMQLLRVGALDAHVMRLERRLPHAEVQALAQAVMAADPGVEYAVPDRILQPLLVPTDTQYGQQWHYFESVGGINLPNAWDRSTGTGLVVAVVDTGYRPHADLAANILPGYDFINDSAVANDGNARDSSALDPGDAVRAGECGSGSPSQDLPSSWHGTHVAGTVAALANNGAGVAGVAFGAKVLPVRVLGKCGGYTSDIVAGVIWASGGSVPGVPANPNPARVINLSLGGSGSCDAASRDAINAARSRGTVVVVAAGNSNANAANFSPASCPGVIAVAATNRSGARAYYSNYGSVVSVAAPGGDMRAGAAGGILSTLNSGSTAPGADAYAYYQGTSMAAPHVAGVVALMLARNPSLSPDDVATRLKGSARAFPATCSQCGTGIVDASAAIDAAAGGGSPPPLPPPSSGNEVEPNNSFSAAQAVTQGTTVNGTMASSSDADYFRVSVAAGGRLSATLTPNAPSDYDLYVYNSAGWLVARSVRGTGLVDTASVANGAAAAIYYVRVRFYSGATGAAGSYTLAIN